MLVYKKKRKKEKIRIYRKTMEMKQPKEWQHQMTTIYFSNHQKRQLDNFLKKHPCIIYVTNCLEREFQKLAIEQNKKYQCLKTEIH